MRCQACGGPTVRAEAYDRNAGPGKGAWMCLDGLCGMVTAAPVSSSSHSHGNDSNPSGTRTAAGGSCDRASSYAPHGKTQTSTPLCPGCGDWRLTPAAGGWLRCQGCGRTSKPGELRRPQVETRPAGRCARHGCGHLLSMHDEGGCALAECSCHEAVALPARSLGVEVKGSCAGEGCSCGDLPAMLVHAIELENLTGLASLRMSAYARTAADRTTLVLRVGVAS